MEKKPKIFSLEEANALVPQLESRLRDLIAKKEDYIRQHDAIFMHELLHQNEKKDANGATLEALDQDIRKLEEALTGLENELNVIKNMGCLVRNLDMGWVDFLGYKGKDLVYFSWRLGEKSIGYYRPLKSRSDERIPFAL